jgi:hypothetical protein
MRAAPSIADEIERHLRTGDTNTMGSAWPGDLMERGRSQQAELRGSLGQEVRRLANGHTHDPVLENAGIELAWRRESRGHA